MTPFAREARGFTAAALLTAAVLSGCAGKSTTTEQSTTMAGAGSTGASSPGTAAAPAPTPGSAPDAAKEPAVAATGTMPVKPDVEPQHIQVQHILIGFAGSVPGKPITRGMPEAKTLAYEILNRARQGEDFDALVREYTDDSPPGIYGMSAVGVAPAQGEYPRDRMVPAFGNVGFAISVGNIGIADYDPTASPYGWHIIKRLK